MLSLTPGKRLAVLQDQVDSLLTLRAKFEVLSWHRVDFIIVRRQYGAHAGDRRSIARLLSALEELEAGYRAQPDR
jgi:hypothetical protein